MRIAPLLLTLLLTTPALAQAPRTVTYEQALRLAAGRAPSVIAARARARAVAAQEDVARAGYLPSLTLGANGNLGFAQIPQRVGAMGADVVSFSFLSLAGDSALNGRLNLYDFGRTANAVRAAELGSEASRQDARAALRQSLLGASVAYFTALADREVLSNIRATVAQREAHLRIAQGLVGAGTRPPIEALRAELNLEAARLDLTVAEANARGDLAGLAAALGLEPTELLEVVPVEDPPAEDDDPIDAAERALRERPELSAARIRAVQAEVQAETARAGRLPTLSATASASLRYTTVLNGQGTPGPTTQISGGLAFTWPLFDPTVRANVVSADANAVAARASAEQVSLTVRAEATQAAIAVQAARSARDQSLRLAAAAAANLEQAAGRYAQGATGLLELVDAQAADASARISVVRARVNLLLARARMEAATGALEARAR
ncbi:MAG: TolC family protein [Deltaproteobacteria bacterium]|nr:TolC family protein [Deltaproteobacteria bacterium]